MQPYSPPSAASAGRYAFAALITGNLVMALGPWMVRLADVGPVASAFWRLALAAPILVLLAGRRQSGGIGQTQPLVPLLALGGLFFAADLAAWHVGIGMTKLANASLFGNCSSFLFALYGFLILKQLPRRVQLAALLLAALGAGLLMGSSYELSRGNFIGDLFTLLAGVFYAAYLVVVDRARRTMSAMPVLAVITAAGALPLLLFANLLGEAVMPRDWTPLLILSIGSQVIGQGLLVYAVGYLSPVVVGVGLLAQPVAAAAIGRIAYGETMNLTDVLGALLIAAALILIRLPERPLASKAGEDHS